MASKPKAPLKTASKATAKVVDENLSAADLAAKDDFINNHVGDIKPAFAEAVVHQIGGWRFFSLYAHDVAECGIESGFKGFMKDADCKAFFADNKKLLKDFYKPKVRKTKAMIDPDLFVDAGDVEPQPFSEQDIEAVFSSKAKADEIKAAQLADDDYSENNERGDFHESRHEKQSKDITVWLACNAAQQVFDAYAGMYADRFDDDIIEVVDDVLESNDDFDIDDNEDEDSIEFELTDSVDE